MSPEYFIAPALLITITIAFAWLLNRSQKRCPFCRGMTIDFADMRGPDKGVLMKVMGISNFDLNNPRRIVVCEKCQTAFDCRPREQIYRTAEDGHPAIQEIENRLHTDDFALPLDAIRCYACGNPVSKSDDFSLAEKEKDFAFLQLRKVAADLSDRSSYLCRKCGTINIWRKVPGCGYFILGSHPNLPRYPEAAYIVEAKQRAVYMEEISLGNAKWSFQPDKIVARPPSLAKDPFGICNLSGEFVISHADGTITCGKKSKRREWPLDDTWRMMTENFSTDSYLCKQLTTDKQAINSAQVKLFSRKHKVCFIMYVGQKYACQDVEGKIRRWLDLPAPGQDGR